MDPLIILEQYYSPDSELAHILLSHSRDVATLALEICHIHPELGADEQFVYEATMLHDIGIFLTNAPKIHCMGKDKYIMHGYLGAELLRREHHLPQHAWVAERHTGAGLTLSDIERLGLSLPPGTYMPESIEERIICYADKFYSKTRLGERATLEKVRQAMAKYGVSALARFENLHAQLGFYGI